MGTNRKRLVAAAASMVVAVAVAGCGGDSDNDTETGTNTDQERTEAAKGGTVYSLELSVTEHLDPQRVYVGRDISNLGRLVYRSWVIFPLGETDAAKARHRPGPGHRHRPVQRGRDRVVVHPQGRPGLAGRPGDHV